MSVIFKKSPSISSCLDSFWSCFISAFGPSSSCKFVVKDGCNTMVSCITEILPEFCYEVTHNPLYEVIYASVMSHHNIHGCGTATMMAMVYFWHQELMTLCSEEIDNEVFIPELDACLEVAITCLDSVIISLKSKVLQTEEDFYDELPNEQHQFNNSIQSRTFWIRNSEHGPGVCNDTDCARNMPHLQKDCSINLDNICHLVRELGHGCDLTSDLLAEAWKVQLHHNKLNNFSLEKALRLDLSQITTITIKSASTVSRVVSGLLLKVNYQTFEILSRNDIGSMRILLINGNVTQSFLHKGVNLQFKSGRFATVNNQETSVKMIWISNVINVLRKLAVNFLLISGGVDEELFAVLCGEEISVITGVNFKILEALANASGAAVASYVNDCDELNVVVGISVSVENDCDVLKKISSEQYVVLHAPENFQTVVICHPISDYLSCLEHNFWHTAHRLSSATFSNKLLPGKGAAEEHAANSLHTASCVSTISTLARNVIAGGLRNYSNTIRKKLSNDGLNSASICPSTNELILDDYYSKIESWRTALSLLHIIAKTDMAVVCGNFDNRKNYYQAKELLGTL